MVTVQQLLLKQWPTNLVMNKVHKVESEHQDHLINKVLGAFQD